MKVSASAEQKFLRCGYCVDFSKYVGWDMPQTNGCWDRRSVKENCGYLIIKDQIKNNSSSIIFVIE